MKNRSIYFVISIITLALGIAAVWSFYQFKSSQIQAENVETSVNALAVPEVIPANDLVTPRFRYISGSPTCNPVYYSFQSSTEEKVYSDDCIGCGEVGNISIYKESQSAKITQYLFKANSEKEVVEKSSVNKNGVKIGERAISLFKDKNKIVNARLFWTEGDDFWIIDAPTLEIVKEFENSENFKSVRLDVDSACSSK